MGARQRDDSADRDADDRLTAELTGFAWSWFARTVGLSPGLVLPAEGQSNTSELLVESGLRIKPGHRKTPPPFLGHTRAEVWKRGEMSNCSILH